MKRFDLDSIRAIPIQLVAADLGFSLTVKGAGRCRLPGHEDHNPSFSVRLLTNRFTCYACGRNGDVIDIVMAMEGLDFKEACYWLLVRYLGNTDRSVVQTRSIVQNTRVPTYEPSLCRKVKPAAASDSELFGWLLERSPLGDTGTAYLRSRGFSEATVRYFRVGQVGDPAKLLLDADARFGRERLNSCGVISEGRFGEYFVFPKGYLLFPFSSNGEVVYLQARRPDQYKPLRWICLNKLQPTVFNGDVLAENVSTISICEGVTDVLSAHELGLSAIGLAGANARIDATTLEKLRGYNVAVFGDGDGSGARFSRELIKLLSTKGITAVPKRLPKGVNDLNDHLKRSRGLA